MKTSSYFKTRDDHRLYCEIHSPQKPKAALVVVHGLNEHCGRYGNLVGSFEKDFALYLFDLRGHGKSDGSRSYVGSFSEFVGDTADFVNFARADFGGKKMFLVAHSMGGQVGLTYLAQNPQAPLAGFATSSANIRLGWKLNPLKRFLGTKLAQYLPKLRLPGEVDVKWISRDPEVVRAYKDDPLVSQSVSLALARELLSNQKELPAAAAKIKMPALMMHAGADRISAPSGTEDFFKSLAAKDKTLKIYPGYYHELFNDVGKEAVFKDLREWIGERT